MYISTLRKIIEAMGGQLDIRAILPGGIVRINQFEDIRRPTRVRPRRLCAPLQQPFQVFRQGVKFIHMVGRRVARETDH